MNTFLERLLRTVDPPDAERAEVLWAEYRAGGTDANAAFATLLAWYGNSLYRRIWGFVRSDAAEDVFQDVLAKLHRERANLATFAHALRWLRAVAVTQSVDAQRRAARRNARDRRAARPEAVTPPETETQEAIAAALSRLPADEQQAIALQFFEGLTKKDAAAVLGIDRGTFAARIRKALGRLHTLVPAPAFAAGGAVALPTALSAHPLALPPARLGELVSRAAGTGRGVTKILVVAVGLVVCGGATVGLVATRPTGPANPSPPPVVVAKETPREAVPTRIRREFDRDVLPELLAALKGLALGDGEVRAERVEAFDTRISVTVAFFHKLELAPGWVSRARFIRDTQDGQTWVMLDFDGKGVYRLVDTKQPIKHRIEALGINLTFPFEPLTRSVAAFDKLTRDAATAAEAEAHREALRKAFEPLTGRWYRGGDPARPCTAMFAENGPRLVDDLTFWCDGWANFRVLPDGRVRALFYHGGPADFSADGRRLDFAAPNNPWTREPGVTK